MAYYTFLSIFFKCVQNLFWIGAYITKVYTLCTFYIVFFDNVQFTYNIIVGSSSLSKRKAVFQNWVNCGSLISFNRWFIHKFRDFVCLDVKANIEFRFCLLTSRSTIGGMMLFTLFLGLTGAMAYMPSEKVRIRIFYYLFRIFNFLISFRIISYRVRF